MAVAHHQPPAVVLVALLDEALHVLVDLGLQSSGDHPPRSLARQLVQAQTALLTARVRDPRNITHGVPSFLPASPASVSINREGTPPSSSRPSTTFGYSSSEYATVEAQLYAGHVLQTFTQFVQADSDLMIIDANHRRLVFPEVAIHEWP